MKTSVQSCESIQSDTFRAGSLVLSDLPGLTSFAEEIEDAMDGEELRYSERVRLLERAEQFGLRRFDAHLLIALVQSRVHDLDYRVEPASPDRFPLKLAAAAFVVTQALIIASVWLVLR
ncbi:MAG TPA: hypothetical protein VH518_18975 [Tepidisphaeraceae bacterium]